jgi:acetolactate synthase-1/2/3 large subunit
MKVSEYVANFVAQLTRPGTANSDVNVFNHKTRVYGVCGAGAMHLNDALAGHPGVQVISMQHEQAAAMAAEADARVTGGIGVVMVTAGPGGSNALTGVACAYVDSIPMLIIAGQVTTNTMIGHNGLRQVGMNELDMVSMMRPVTKYAVTVTDPYRIRETLESAVYKATHGRKGPVFVEIPLDVQAAQVDPEHMWKHVPGAPLDNSMYLDGKVKEVLKALGAAKRPVVIVGNGVRLAHAVRDFRRVFDHLGVPVVSSWGAADVMPTDHPYYIGRCGLFGDRASNFAVQSADLILAIGTRLSVAQIGHTPERFAPNAVKVIVDVDSNEIYRKPTIKADIGVIADAREFLEGFWPHTQVPSLYDEWMAHCQNMKAKYPPIVCAPAQGINSYFFVEQLSEQLADDAVVVTDVGFCFIPTMQSLKLKAGQRLIHSAGVSPMGWGLPASIGASFAGSKQTVCLTGDGGLMMNLQDLQTIVHYQLPIVIFVFENNGYATMQIAQRTHFKREVMSSPRSGMSLPDFVKVAKAFGLYVVEFNVQNALAHSLQSIFDIASQGPVVVVMHMEQNELISPRVMARTENGAFLPTDIADMWPYLPRSEFASNMHALTNGGFSDVVDRIDQRGQKVLGTG